MTMEFPTENKRLVGACRRAIHSIVTSFPQLLSEANGLFALGLYPSIGVLLGIVS